MNNDELDVGLDARHEQWLREQYLRDLATLERIERQREEQDPCFFCAMGEIIMARGHQNPPSPRSTGH